MKSPFIFSKFANHGSSNPIVARLTLQSSKIFECLIIDEAVKNSAFEILLNLQERLLGCYEIQVRLQDKKESEINNFILELRKGNNQTRPNIAGLNVEAESFLLLAKQYIRDVPLLINCLFRSKLKIDPAIFWDPRKESQSPKKWAEENYGKGSTICDFLITQELWITELVRKRNSCEHPDGFSGNLEFTNIEFQKGIITFPTWTRTANGISTTTYILDDMNAFIENLMQLAEIFIILAFEQFPKVGKLKYKIIEIEEPRRDPACRERFKIEASLNIMD